GGVWPPALFRLSNNLFLASIVAMLLWTLIRHRKGDSYRDNYFFLVILPAFLVAKFLMLGADHMQAGWSMALGLFRVAFLVMLERTLTQFMKGVFRVSILRDARLDLAIKGLALVLVVEGLLPPAVAAWLALALALLLAARFAFWKPQLAMRRLDLGIMYLGYLAIVLQLLLSFGETILGWRWVGTITIHLFTFGVMGLIIPAMLIRISRGHTGRKVVFDAGDKAVLWIMILGFLLRIVAPQVYPAGYALWINLAAACWFLGFSVLAQRYIPFLLRPRVDGKVH
ncbi:MAG TPA: NnrS family protein, partial [Burkholderiales bacterium]